MISNSIYLASLLAISHENLFHSQAIPIRTCSSINIPYYLASMPLLHGCSLTFKHSSLLFFTWSIIIYLSKLRSKTPLSRKSSLIKHPHPSSPTVIWVRWSSALCVGSIRIHNSLLVCFVSPSTYYIFLCIINT